MLQLDPILPRPPSGASACWAARGSLFDPGGELCKRRFLREASGSRADIRRNPIREGDFFGDVTSRTCVYLAHLGKVI